MIEVLASMAVLVILVLALTRMFMEAANITKRGTTMIMRNSTLETAMETILKDTESMVVNERLPCYIVADQSDPGGFGFDEAYFITTSGDQDDDRAYQLRRYRVREQVSTNSLGALYRRYQLLRDLWIFSIADSRNVDVMAPNTRWWLTVDSWRAYDTTVLADNVVRFDIYCLGWDGEDWMDGQGPSSLHEFDSIRGPAGNPPRNVPPAAFDIYLQVTSPEAAMEGGMALVDGVPADVQEKARALMIRESATMIGRASPVMGPAQLHHPARHYSDPQ